MSLTSSKSTSSRRSGVKFTTTILALCLLQLLSVIHPTSAIGGWDPIHILMNRLSGERSQSEQQHSDPQKRIAPLEKTNASIKKAEGSKKNKRHAGEVAMTTSKKPSSSSSDPANIPRGRRGEMHLDEDDLRTITFVGRSNPFL
mmetsp:Transcript_25226/g.54335  ORF Transcript_25226/g.54335 Transcript_25226/m.54335 type:complete len:144 (+) Transcript_25226:136-567(+)|eukprot:CAMPEP_0172309696 /NCGR_PEP_ID=MMETSP1058-20130122/10451_1 /TAXON_ID=83371 /ORGANISM="Detonula confervacea, Strain CCMP 353" /LENGTH=143 /DNA_ID=CAMNT_0013022369 /DNA_START=111 /DNA_END=542 /DNA_ORIENTATION=+